MLNHGQKSFPLGRYLQGRLRKELGLDEKEVKEKNMLRWSQELAAGIKEDLKDPLKANWGLFKIQGRKNQQKVWNIEAKAKLFGSKKGRI